MIKIEEVLASIKEKKRKQKKSSHVTEMMDQLIMTGLMRYRKTSVDHIGHGDWKGKSVALKKKKKIPLQPTPTFILFSILTFLFLLPLSD